MTRSRTDHSRLIVTGAFLAPIVAAMLIRGIGADPVAMVLAQPPAQETPELPPPPLPVNNLDAAYAALGADPGENPFLDADAGDVAAPIAEAPRAEPDPDVALTSVMAGRRGAVAILNGKPRQIGDTLGNGWSVATIDPAAGVVTLRRESDGKTIAVSRRRAK